MVTLSATHVDEDVDRTLLAVRYMPVQDRLVTSLAADGTITDRNAGEWEAAHVAIIPRSS